MDLILDLFSECIKSKKME